MQPQLMLSDDAMIPVTDEPMMKGYSCVRIHDLSEIAPLYCNGAILYISKIRGAFMFLPIVEEK